MFLIELLNWDKFGQNLFHFFRTHEEAEEY